MSFWALYKQINKGIEIEIEHKYIDFVGKKSSFSSFVLASLNKLGRLIERTEMSRIEPVRKCFEQYPLDSASGRRASINMLESALTYFYKIFKEIEHKEELARRYSEKVRELSEGVEGLENIDVAWVKGVGPKLALIFKKLGIATVAQLLEYYPRKYINYQGSVKIRDLKIGDEVCIFARVKSVGTYSTRNRLTVLNVTLEDSTGILGVTFFYKALNRTMLHRYKAQYPVGASVSAIGKVKKDSYTGKLTLDKAQITVLGFDAAKGSQEDKIVPIYPLTESLAPKTLQRAILNAYDAYGAKLGECLPPYLVSELELLGKKEAVSKIHFPNSQEDVDNARFRLVFEELFLLQLHLNLIREKNKKTNTSIPLKTKPNGLVERFIEQLPFELTGGQKSAVNEILHDLNSTESMQRLLQGDVGSGKTVVACITLLAAIENGYQGAIMAPTEILATQHYRNFIEWLTPLNLSVGLFLGKHGAKLRKEMLTSLKNGQTHLAIGTHALIQEGVEFSNLGAVVIDEQHRFGVNQRSNLLNKSKSPQMLTMTATPIPRTLALTVHGDLDVTTIDELPKGRKPIITTLSTSRTNSYNLIREEITKGHQAYIVYPLIDESETISAKNATQEAKKLAATTFSNYRIGLLHGKLRNEEKDKVMADFKAKKYDILVSTTVVEVGVDVPNATVMMIENAERFGLSQLHQLRGRVGRSDRQSYCLLTTTSSSKQVKERLSVLVQTNNGFIVAQKDLELRGPGEFLGTRQSGLPDFGLADIVNDIEILEIAREKAIEFVKGASASTKGGACPPRNIADYPALNHEIQKRGILTSLRSG